MGELAVPFDDSDEIDGEEARDLLRCMRYLVLQSSVDPDTGKAYTLADAREMSGVTEATDYRWRKQGLYKQAMRLLAGQLSVHFQSITASVWDSLPDIIGRQIEIATGKTSKDKDALASARFLMDIFIKPGLLGVTDPGAKENAYLESNHSLDPLAPAHFKVTIEPEKPVVIDT